MKGEYRLIYYPRPCQAIKKGILVKYNIKNLSSITFGIKTTDDKKLEIIKLIHDKHKTCKFYKMEIQNGYYKPYEIKIENGRLVKCKNQSQNRSNCNKGEML